MRRLGGVWEVEQSRLLVTFEFLSSGTVRYSLAHGALARDLPFSVRPPAPRARAGLRLSICGFGEFRLTLPPPRGSVPRGEERLLLGPLLPDGSACPMPPVALRRQRMRRLELRGVRRGLAARRVGAYLDGIAEALLRGAAAMQRACGGLCGR